MPLPITTIAVALLALLLVVLSVMVVRLREKHGQSFGDGGNTDLMRAVRAHANLVEHAPMALILLAALEVQGGSLTLVMVLVGILVAARLAHAVGVLTGTGLNALRVGGVLGTWAVLAVGALAALYYLFR